MAGGRRPSRRRWVSPGSIPRRHRPWIRAADPSDVSDWAGPWSGPAQSLTSLGSAARIQGRCLRGIDPGLTQRRLEGRRPPAIVHGCLNGVVEELAHLCVVLREANSVALFAEGLTYDRQLVGVLRGVAEQDRTVSRNRIDGAVLELGDTLGVRRERDRVCAVLVDHPLQRGRPGYRAHLLTSGVLRLGDRVLVLRAHQQLLAGDVVRTSLADNLSTLIGDGVRREDDVDRAVPKERLAVVRDRFLPLDTVVVDAEGGRDDPAHLDVESLGGVGAGLEESDPGLVELHTDRDLSGVGELRHRRAGVDLRTVSNLNVGSATAAAGGQHEREAGSSYHCLGFREPHDFSFFSGREPVPDSVLGWISASVFCPGSPLHGPTLG